MIALARLAVVLVAATTLVTPALPASAGGETADGCVGEGEYLRIADGWTRANVAGTFGTHGTVVRRTDTRLVITYPRCHSPHGTVVVRYDVPEQWQPKVVAKRWLAPDRGDVRVIEGTFASDRLTLGRPGAHRADHVYGGQGDDVIGPVAADGLVDVIRCGDGEDRVRITGHREAHDRYLDCEHLDVRQD